MGNAWSSTPSIGAFEYVPAGAPPVVTAPPVITVPTSPGGSAGAATCTLNGVPCSSAVYASLSPDIVAVNSSTGALTALKGGRATITVTVGGVTVPAMLVVVGPTITGVYVLHAH